MWTLEDARAKLSERLGEEGNVFWDSDERTSLINEAQRRVAAITGGVSRSVTKTVEGLLDPLTLPRSILGLHATGAGSNERVYNVLHKAEADRIWPGWKRATGVPRWVIVDPGKMEAFIVPAPLIPTVVEVTVAYLPIALRLEIDFLFENQPGMEKYQGAVITLAACLALLKERYDGDAERFYAFFRQEMMDVGVEAGRLPQTLQTPIPQEASQ